MKHLHTLIALLVAPLFLSPVMGQSLSQDYVKEKMSLIKDSIDTYISTGDHKMVLSICENGIQLLSQADYASTSVACVLYLGAAESSMRLNYYRKAKMMFYQAFILDELGQYGCNVYNYVIKEAEADTNMMHFARLLSICKSDSITFQDFAFYPKDLGTHLNDLALEQSNSGNYTAALEYFEMESDLLDAIGETGSDDYLSIVPCKIRCIIEQKDLKSAEHLTDSYVDLVKSYKGINTLAYAEALQAKADAEREFNHLDSAIKLYEESLSLIESIAGKNNMTFIRCLESMGNAYRERDGNHLKWLEIELEAERLLAQTAEATPSDRSSNYGMLANAYSIAGDKRKRLEYAKKAVDVLEESHDIKNSDYAWSLSILCDAYTAMNNYDKAIEAGLKGIKIYSEINMTNGRNISYRFAVRNLSYAYFQSGDTQQAISTIQTILTDEYPDDVCKYENLAKLAEYYSRLGLQDERKAIYYARLKLAEKLQGKDSPLYADALFFCARFQEKPGDAIIMLQEAAKILEKHYGKTSTGYLSVQSALTVLGADLKDTEEFANSQKLHLEQIRSLYGANSRKYYEESILYLDRVRQQAYERRDANAITYVMQNGIAMLKNIESLFGNEDELYLALESNTASYCIDVYNFRRDSAYFNIAIQYQSDVVAKSKRLYGASNLKYITAIESLAAIKSKRHIAYDDTAKQYYYREVEDLQQIAVDYYKTNYGEKNENYARASLTLSQYIYDEVQQCCRWLWEGDEYYSRYQKAITLADNALNYYRSNDDYRYVDIASTYLGWLYDFGRQYDKAATCRQNSFEDWKAGTLSEYSMYTSDEKAKLAKRFYWNINNYSDNAYWNDSSAIYAQVAYDAQLFGKGLLLSSEIGLRELINESGDAAAKEGLARLQKIKTEMSATATTDEEKQRMKTEYRNAERTLMKTSQQYGDYMRMMSATFADVKTCLKDKDVAIEFASISIPLGKRQYYALVLKKDYASPKTVKICSEEALVGQTNLYDAVWKPLGKELQGVENVYFAPTMLLNNLPLESAVCPDGQLLARTGLNLYRLSSTRELIKGQTTRTAKYGSAALYGGLQYDASTEQLIASDAEERENGLRSATVTGDELAQDLRKSVVTWKHLEGTEKEVAEIDKITASHGLKTKLYTDSLGTESTFKNLSKRGVNLIHLATHGFFIESDGTNQAEDEQLERSGIVLAGANNIKMGKTLPEGVDDGVLTAAEISRLDLRGLDLVVLSACETGLGDITSEGVYGLQRGFKKAGAKSIVMSLWRVNDDATRILMTKFYQSLFEGKSKYEALELAKDYVRTVDGGTYSNPQYWSGFILLDGLE